MRKRNKGIHGFDVINGCLLLLVALICVFPMWYVFVISVSDGPSFIADKLHFWPKVISFEQYRVALRAGDLMTGFANSVFITAVGTILAMTVTLMCAYALSKKRLQGRAALTAIILFTMFFSAGLIPNYLLMSALGLKNSHWAIILPLSINAYYTMIMRTYFAGIPDSLEESAKIDGASDFRVLFSLVIPVSTPMIAAVSLFFGVMYYNDYFNALLYITTRKLYPLQFLLREMVINNIANSSSVGGTSTTTSEILRMACVILSIIPILGVYPFLQKYFVHGLMLGAIKE